MARKEYPELQGLRDRITDIMEKLHQDQKTFAEGMGVNRPAWSLFLNGKQGITVKNLERLRDYCEEQGIPVTLDYLLRGVNPPTKKLNLKSKMEDYEREIARLKKELTASQKLVGSQQKTIENLSQTATAS